MLQPSIASIPVKNACIFDSMTPTVERIYEIARSRGVEKRAMRSTLGKICGISPQAVRDWELGTTKNIREEHLAAISGYFGVSLDYLLTGRRREGDSDPGSEEFYRLYQGLPDDEKQLFLRMLRRASSAED